MTPQELEFEYEMAQLDLKAQRFRAAEDKFKALAISENSPEAWCGLGISKYGMIMENVGIEDIFYCFKKAKVIDETQSNDLEKVVVQTSIDVVKNLYDVLLLTQQSIDVAKVEKTRAAISTLVRAAWTIDNYNNERRLGTIATAGLTAMSYSNYVKAGATINEMKAMHRNTLDMIRSIQTALQQYVTKEIELVQKFNNILEDTHTEVTVTIPKKNEIVRLEKKAKSCKQWGWFFYLSVAAQLSELFFGKSNSDLSFQDDLAGTLLLCTPVFLIGYYIQYRGRKFGAQAKGLRRSIGLLSDYSQIN